MYPIAFVGKGSVPMYVDVSVFAGAEIVLYGDCMSERELEDALGIELANDIWEYLIYTNEIYPYYHADYPGFPGYSVVATINTEV
jgi:hypothetical protein